MYALFKGEKQIGNPFPTEEKVWEAALSEGLVTDVPVQTRRRSGYSDRIPRRTCRCLIAMRCCGKVP
jgi:hypothetical protein